MNIQYLDAANTTDTPVFHYTGVVLDPANLKYSPHPDIIHPSVIETGSAWENPLAKYYMYYAPHDAPGGICLAMADLPEGPWREYPHNPIIGNEWMPHYRVSHVSSPDVIWNSEENCLFLYFHGENDTTRYATSHDGINFEYDGIAVTTQDFGSGLTEASYARVFRHKVIDGKGPYIMLLMGTHDGTRCVYMAWSSDRRRWDACEKPLITPPPGTDQMGPGALFTWNGKNYIIAFANPKAEYMYDPFSDLHLYTVNEEFTEIKHLGLLMEHTIAGADNYRINDPCILQTEEKLYLFVNVGRRLHQSIGLAIADIKGIR